MYVDGSSRGNPGPSGIGVLIYDADNRDLPIRTVCTPIGKTTNNKAEYEALIEGLLTVLQMRLDDIAIFSDSNLVVNQVVGDWKVNEDRLLKFRDKARELMKLIPDCTLSFITGKRNKAADAVSKRASRMKLEHQGGQREDGTKTKGLD